VPVDHACGHDMHMACMTGMAKLIADRHHRHRAGSQGLRRALRRPRGPDPRQTVSEDFSKIPDAVGVPYCYWAIGFTDRDTYLAAEKDGHLDDLPTNHSPKFLPPMQPTLRTGTEALVAAALAWLVR